MIKREARVASCNDWKETIRAPIGVNEFDLAAQFLKKRSLPFKLNWAPGLTVDWIDTYCIIWRFRDAFGTTIRFEISIGSKTKDWLWRGNPP